MGARVMCKDTATTEMVGQLNTMQETMDQSASMLGRIIDRGVKAL